MLDSPNRLGVDLPPDVAVKVLAGVSDDKKTIRILMTNPTKNTQSVKITLANLPWSGASRYEQQVVNERYDLQSVDGAHTSSSKVLKQEVAGQSVVLLTIRAAGV
jgi:hypothetical protein